MNTLKTFALMACLTLLLVFAGQLLGGPRAALMALVFASLMNLGLYWFSDRLVLSSYRAREVEPGHPSGLYEIVAELCQETGMPQPRVYVVPSASPNAFATGRSPRRAAVAATDGILRLLDREELKAVLGHELAHVRHRDILIATVAAALAGAISWLAFSARWAAIGGRRRSGPEALLLLGFALLGPLAALIVQASISRAREYQADESGARLSRRPRALARALAKISNGVARVPMDEASPATAHLFIANPLRAGAVLRLFSTHPPMEDRIRRLEELAREMGL